MVAFSGFEATFSLLAQARFGLALASTSAVFAAIGIVLVAVQGGLVHPVTSRLGERGTLRFGLVANAVGLGLLAVDLGWAGLVVALLVPHRRAGPAHADPRRRRCPVGPDASGGSGSGGSSRPAVWPGCVGPILAGSLFEFTGIGAPYVVGAVLALVALALVPAAGRAGNRPSSLAV